MQGRYMPWYLVPSLDDVGASYAPSVSSSAKDQGHVVQDSM